MFNIKKLNLGNFDEKSTFEILMKKVLLHLMKIVIF
jgi:hypothetical protein